MTDDDNDVTISRVLDRTTEVRNKIKLSRMWDVGPDLIFPTAGLENSAIFPSWFAFF